MLTKQSAKLIGAFSILFIVGIFLGSMILFAASSVVLLFLLIALLFEPPQEISIKLQKINSNIVFRDECIDLTFEITVNKGVGTLILMQELSDEFELIEGNNLKVFWKSRGKKTFTMSYKLKSGREGIYNLPKIVWESQHFLGFRQGSNGEGEEVTEIVVKSAVKNNAMIFDIRTPFLSSLHPVSKTKAGAISTDFKELRDYVFGDPLKIINWKATAARISKGIEWPLVTEYEIKGKQALWIFIDGSINMEVGTNIGNAFEYAKEIAQEISLEFLNNGFKVGMCIYNNDAQPLSLGTGKKQFYRISQHLAAVKTSHDVSEGLPSAIQKCRKYLTKHEASSIIITRLDSASIDPLLEGIKMIKGVSGNRRNPPLIIKINIFGHEMLSSKDLYKENALKMINMLHKSMEGQLKSARVPLVSWNPVEDTFSAALLKAKRR